MECVVWVAFSIEASSISLVWRHNIRLNWNRRRGNGKGKVIHLRPSLKNRNITFLFNHRCLSATRQFRCFVSFSDRKRKKTILYTFSIQQNSARALVSDKRYWISIDIRQTMLYYLLLVRRISSQIGMKGRRSTISAYDIRQYRANWELKKCFVIFEFCWPWGVSLKVNGPIEEGLLMERPFPFESRATWTQSPYPSFSRSFGRWWVSGWLKPFSFSPAIVQHVTGCVCVPTTTNHRSHVNYG